MMVNWKQDSSSSNAVLIFNQLARELVSVARFDPLRAVRVYAILSTVQYKIAHENVTRMKP